MEKTFVIRNFGCKVNQEEGGALAALFAAEGWRQDSREPMLIIINTCTVTAVADKKCRNMIRRMRQEHPHALLAVCGCYAQRDAAAVEQLAAADIIVGVEERRLLPALVEKYLAEGKKHISVGDISREHSFHTIYPRSDQSRARAYLKVEDGCDQFCNYCIIPHVRGPVRSLAKEECLAQAAALVEQGHRELVITGIHVGAYGQDLGPGQDLCSLLKELLKTEGLGRLRLGSVEPQQFTDELIELIGDQPLICPHLHIPLQAGSNKILEAMGRRYTAEEYEALLEKLLSVRAELAFTTDMIAGYPGESEADHEEAKAYISRLPFSGMHIFPYSRRIGTPAAALPQQISTAEKERRCRELSAIAGEKSRAFALSHIGRRMDMLLEERTEEGYLRGRAGNYLELLLEDRGELPLRSIAAVRGEKLLPQGLLCKAVD